MKGHFNNKLIFLIYLILFVFGMSFFVPKETNTTYNSFCFILFLIMTFLFFKIKKKKNYFDFDSIFVIVYGIVAFVFPVFLFSFSAPFSEFFGLKYNINFVSKGVYISLLGISGYYAGSLYKSKAICPKTVVKSGPIYTIFLILILILLVLLFYFLGGIQFYQSMYLKSNSIPSGPIVQIIALLQAFMLTAIATEAYNQKLVKNYKYNKLFLITCFVTSLLLLYAGNRTSASFFLLPLIYWYIKENLPLNFFKFSILIFIGILLMWVVQQTRSGGEIKVHAGIEIFKDLTIVNRNTYVGIEYIDNFGFTYGKTMLNGFVGIFPSLERLLNNLFGIEIRDFGSAELLTDYTFHGKNINNLGLGTNIFIDLFISFGLLGTFLLMFFLGYFVKYSFNKSNNLNYYHYIIYTVLVAHSVFLVRASITYPIRLIIWSLVIGYLNKAIVDKFSKKNNAVDINS